MASSSSSTNPIPRFYRIWNTYVDSVICLGTAYGFVFHPHYVLRQFVAAPAWPLSLETRFLTDMMGGVFVFLAIMLGVFFRVRSADVAAWTVVMGAFGLLDVAILGGMVRSLEGSGRLWVLGNWTQEEIVSFVFTGFALALHAAFCLRVGFETRSEASGRSKGKPKAK